MYSAAHAVGGQSVPKFDYDLAPGVRKTFTHRYLDNIARLIYFNTDLEIGEIRDVVKSSYKEMTDDEQHMLSLSTISAKYQECERANIIRGFIENGSDIDRDYLFDLLCESQNKAWMMAEKETDRATYQAMEALVHNLNTMHSRAGAQVPFSSINYGTDTSPEGRMVIKNILLALEAGLGNGETPIFPIHIFKVKEGVNYNPKDPNYDLFKLSCEVSAKRLFPNFSFIDAPFNKQFYKKGDPNTEIAYMGCVQGDEVVTYKVDDKLYVQSFKRFWEHMNELGIKEYGNSEYIVTEGKVLIYDSSVGDFVGCKKIIKNPNKNDWVQVKFNNGRNLTCTLDHPLPIMNGSGELVRTLMKDVKIGDKVPVTYNQYSSNKYEFDSSIAWLLGLLVCDSNYDTGIVLSLGVGEEDIIDKVMEVANTKWNAYVTVKDMRKYNGENYYQVRINCGEQSKFKREYLFNMFGGGPKIYRQLPNEVFEWCEDARYGMLAGLIDADGYCTKDSRGTRVMLGSTNKELALQEMALAQSLGLPCKMYITTYSSHKDDVRYRIEFGVNEKLYSHMASEKKRVMKVIDDKECVVSANIMTPDVCEIVSIERIDIDEYSYDVETTSDRFDVSGILSHNCRTRVISNVNGPEVVTSRGNLSFTSINLPRLAIMGALNDPHNGTHTAVETFFELLDEMMNHAIDQLMHRFRIQCQRKVKNHPFLMGQGVWMDSENLSPDDTLEEVLKHGSLSVGFIGLAEALKVLTGYHHGESKEAWDLGYKIIKHMRDRMDEEAEKTKLNFSLLATPAEGLCLAGDTLVQTPYGNKKIKDIAEGDQVFSYNLKTHKIEIDVVAKSQMTSPKRKVMKITFDTGQEVICTPNHPFAVRTINRDKYGRIIKIDGFTESIDFVNAEDLKVGNRIKSNYIELSNSGYYRFKNNEFIHKMVYEFYNGPIPKGYVVHHKNEKKHDNSIDNLMLMSAKEHRILHMRDTIGKFCYTSTSQQGENNSFYGKKHSEFVKKLISESKILNRNVSNLIKDYFDGIKTDMLAEKYNVSEISICRKLRQRGVSLEANHIITKIEYLEDEIPVYDITMTNNSNFFVGGDRGILVHNSGRFVKIDAERFGKIPEVTDREYYTNSFHQWWLDTYVSRKSA